MSDTSVHALPGPGSGPDQPPQPSPDVDTEGFWAATARDELAICRCRECRAWLHPPLERCRRCGGATAFETIDGTGRIYSFIVTHREAVPGLGPGPHVIVVVDLDGAPGVRLSGRLVGADRDDVEVGAVVRARLVDLPGGFFRAPEFVLDA